MIKLIVRRLNIMNEKEKLLIELENIIDTYDKLLSKAMGMGLDWIEVEDMKDRADEIIEVLMN